MNRFIHRVGQLAPVDGIGAGLVLRQHLDQVDGTQVAALIGQERLFAAGIGGFDFPLSGYHVVPVEPVQKDDARFAVAPGGVDDFVKNLPGTKLADRQLGAGFHEIVHFALFHRFHELLSDAHGNVEIGDVGVVRLAVDETQNVGMIDPQDTHIGASAGAALLNGLRGHVEDPHEADGTAGYAAGGIDRAARGPQAGEGEAGAAARFVDEGGLLDGLEDILHTVLHRQHKTGGQLPQGTARIHQGGRVGQKFQAGHQFIELLLQPLDVRLRLIIQVGGGDSLGHPAE